LHPFERLPIRRYHARLMYSRREEYDENSATLSQTSIIFIAIKM